MQDQLLSKTALMEGKDLPNWGALERELEDLRLQLKTSASRLLFRGHADSTFRLTTTLERAGCQRMLFRDWYRLATRIKPAVETLSGVKWDLPDYSVEIEDMFQTKRELLALRQFPTADFYRWMVYLRHHGFPSPLLDWSYSRHVAAFFAFRDEPVTKPEKRSIYVYCEMPLGVKGGAVGAPTIRRIGPYITSHPRHFRQQSDYTLCGAFDSDVGWKFSSHEEVLGVRQTSDILWKFNLPSTERMNILRSLDEYNLNAFSLFDSEETLLETMWFREHTARQSDGPIG